MDAELKFVPTMETGVAGLPTSTEFGVTAVTVGVRTLTVNVCVTGDAGA
jgi:hypothetical protein